MKPRFKTTKADFAYFVERCRYWIEEFQLNDHEWDFEHKLCDDCLAEFKYDREQRHVTMRLNTNWDDDAVTRDELNKTAFHEICEAMLFDVEDLAWARATPDERNAARHATVNRIYRAMHEEGI